VKGSRPWRAALALGEPSASILVLVEAAEAARFPLEGRTRREAFDWLEERARELGGPAARLSLEAPYTMPAHPFGAGAPFASPDREPLAELARWFACADAVLRELVSGWPDAAPVRVWPHHFDVGSVLPLGGGDGEDASSIGVGLSPGDEGIAEPYFYVTAWPPPPPAEELPALPSIGRWHRAGWTGALLTGSEVVAEGGAVAQSAGAKAFLAGAVQLLRARHETRRG
jgi:hypothetical protein